MQTAWARAMFGGMLAVTATWLMAVGCSSTSSDQPAPDAAAAQCPRSVDDALVAVCGADGEECPIGYSCGDTPEQAHCTCTKHKYACVDATGADIVKGTPPACVPVGPANDKECPASETGTEGLACKTAGLLCHYTGVQCPGAAVPNTDTCQCEGSPKGGLAFHCEPVGCNPRSDASDDAFTVPDVTVKDSPEDG